MKASKTKLLNYLIKEVCKIEGGKKSLNAPECRQVIKVIATLFQNDVDFYSAFFSYIDLNQKKAKKKK